MLWADAPPAGTRVCGGFDGSSVDDWSVIKLETLDGLLFTPRVGPDLRAAVWNPAEHGGRIPRGEVHAAWELINDMYLVERVYCDPPRWESEIGGWAQKYGEKVFLPWETYRGKQMHEALETFLTDLSTGVLRQDGCPVTTRHVLNARKKATSGDRYGIRKPSQGEKIDAAMSAVLAHKAAVDARAHGWGADPVDSRVFCFR